MDYNVNIDRIAKDHMMLYAEKSMGNGVIDNISDVIYVDIDVFDKSDTVQMTYEIEKLNKLFAEEKKKYLRLFNKQKGNFNHKPVHEDVEIEGEATWLKGSLLHYSYRDLHHYFEKFNQYTSLAAKELAKQGKRKSGLYLYFRFGISFWQYYLIKGFVKDGFPGFVWSICSAFYPIVKYAKARAIIEKK
jgi:hypothetical protein